MLRRRYCLPRLNPQRLGRTFDGRWHWLRFERIGFARNRQSAGQIGGMGLLYRVRRSNVGGLAERFPRAHFYTSWFERHGARRLLANKGVRLDIGRLEGVANRLDGGAAQRPG